MNYQLEIKDNISIIRVQSERITHAEAPDMKTTFLKLLTEETTIFVLNLSKLNFMDSTGLGAMLFGLRQAEANDKEIIFCGLSDKIKSLVRIARLDSILEIYTTEDEAIKEILEDRN